MIIDSVDVGTTKKLVLRQKRQKRVEDFIEKQCKGIKIDDQLGDINISATSDKDDSRMDLSHITPSSGGAKCIPTGI